MMELEMPLDADGYLDRECPACARHFRWHHGPVEGSPAEEPDPPAYFCPYCGADAPLDQWWTADQVEAMQQTAAGEALTELRRAFRQTLSGSSHVTFRPGTASVPPPSPLEMDDVDELIAVASPCHPYEPVKVMRQWRDPFHCLVCGSSFVV